MSNYGKTTKVFNQLSGLVHKTNELVNSKTQYHLRFEALNIEQTEKFKQQKRLRDQLTRQVLGGNIEEGEEDLDGRFFYDNEYNLPEDVIEYVMKFLAVKDRSKVQVLQEWQTFFKDRNDFDKNRLEKLVFTVYDKRKQELEQQQTVLTTTRPIDWIDEVDAQTKQLFELEVKDLDYVIDSSVSIESLSELPLITWEDQLFRQRDQNVADIQMLLNDSIRPKQQAELPSLELQHKNYVLEDDEDRNFSLEMDLVGDQVRTAVHRYHKQQQLDQILSKSIDRLINMKSFSSEDQKQDLEATDNKPQKATEKDIQLCLELMSQRKLTPPQVQERLNLTEDQLKQMYTLYQKALQFDRMQVKYQQLKEQQERALQELKSRIVSYDHLHANNLHGVAEYANLHPKHYENRHGQQEPEDVGYIHPALVPPAQATAHILQKQKSQQVQSNLSDELSHFIKLNEEQYLTLLKELKIKFKIYSNQSKLKEAQVTNSKIHELNELYISAHNPNVLYYKLRQFKEQLII